MRFYAGAPLHTNGGSALGTLCVIDTSPRAAFTPEESAILTELATIVSEQMEQRLQRRSDRAGIARHGGAQLVPAADL